MTTTKEDQMRAEPLSIEEVKLIAKECGFTIHPLPWDGTVEATFEELQAFAKACAESYEKKLALATSVKDEAVRLHTIYASENKDLRVRVSCDSRLIEAYEKKLAEKDVEIQCLADSCKAAAENISEANVRNARLVEIAEVKMWEMFELGKKHYRGCAKETIAEFYQAITANAESVAAWEAEKLEPLRDALILLEKDSHQYGTRPCKTCSEVSTLIKRNFGCMAVAKAKKG